MFNFTERPPTRWRQLFSFQLFDIATYRLVFVFLFVSWGVVWYVLFGFRYRDLAH